MWNAHFASRNSLAHDTPASANGLDTADTAQVDAFEAARAAAITQADTEHAGQEVAVTIIARDGEEIETIIEVVTPDE